MPIINRIADFHDDMTAWRRDLHAHPELGFQEHRTSALVQEKLQSFGLDEVVTGLARTGVVGVIRGRVNSGRAIGLRADMDALPILEETDLPYKSLTPGLMHACGHDGHTTMLLGAARYLAETRNFDGTVYVIFQPAEDAAGLRPAQLANATGWHLRLEKRADHGGNRSHRDHGDRQGSAWSEAQ
jgi:amidohydrolase